MGQEGGHENEDAGTEELSDDENGEQEEPSTTGTLGTEGPHLATPQWEDEQICVKCDLPLNEGMDYDCTECNAFLHFKI